MTPLGETFSSRRDANYSAHAVPECFVRLQDGVRGGSEHHRGKFPFLRTFSRFPSLSPKEEVFSVGKVSAKLACDGYRNCTSD